MLSNIKLPHWAMVLVSLVSIVLAWGLKENASGELVLPAVVLGIVPIVQTLLGFFSPSVTGAK
jgi:hypothetical protein